MYRGPSESQSIAEAEVRFRRKQERQRRSDEETADRQQRAHWTSRDRRRERLAPVTLHGLLTWFRAEYEGECPPRLHATGVWFDTVSGSEIAQAVKKKELVPQSVGGSAIGSLPYAPEFRMLLEGSPHARDEDGDLLYPLRSAMSAMKRQNPNMAALLIAVARADFDWKAVAGQPFFTDEMMVIPQDVLAFTLRAGLSRLWQLMIEREAMVPIGEV